MHWALRSHGATIRLGDEKWGEKGICISGEEALGVRVPRQGSTRICSELLKCGQLGVEEVDGWKRREALAY